IKVPRLNYKQIQIRLHSKPNINQEVTVYLNNERIDKYLFVNDQLEINLQLHDESKDVDVKLVFENEYSRFRNVFSRMLFFYKPKYIAAEITSVVMS
ncbi:MAG: hypothetical protein KAT90_13935, partial [Gammaproteobacteria bacterium]|nr:hypothetical protein [Gammaproteobacteria bacterium]